MKNHSQRRMGQPVAVTAALAFGVVRRGMVRLCRTTDRESFPWHAKCLGVRFGRSGAGFGPLACYDCSRQAASLARGELVAPLIFGQRVAVQIIAGHFADAVRT